MAPPAKRRKPHVLPPSSSASEDENGSVSKTKSPSADLVFSLPTVPDFKETASSKRPSQSTSRSITPQPQIRTAKFPSNTALSRIPKQVRGKPSNRNTGDSPEKRKRKGDLEEKGKNVDILTFFTKQTQCQQAKGSLAPSGNRSKLSTQTTNADDADSISDDDVDDDNELLNITAQSSSLIGLTARKRARGTETFKNDDGDFPSASQKFLKPRTLVDAKTNEELRPWAERFAPISLEELAVHKKKVADVRAWLEDVTSGRVRQRLLLLKGAAGTGKTTTVQLLANAMNYEVLEWRNPVGSVASSDGFQSMAAQFEDFMGRSGKFGQLDMVSNGRTVSEKPGDKSRDRQKRVILIEEFPNTFAPSSTSLQSFRTTILQYIASNTPPLSQALHISSTELVTPVVIIVSETLLTTTSASADSFTAHRLLGPEIIQHPGVGTIEFNAIAPTISKKALELVVQKESRRSGRRKTPGPLVLKRLSEIGDIRNAVGSLEFLCLRGDFDSDWGSKVAFVKTRKTNKDVALTKMEEESLLLVTAREASLGIFHAVGKVVYNKREETAPILIPENAVENLPSFMSTHSRSKKSQVDVETLIDETGTDTQTFVAALHENYILSCNAPPTSFDFATLDHVNGCIDALSDSDLLCPSWDGSFNSTGFGGGTGGRGSGGDILRQDEFSFQIAVRGLLFSLPNPVKRKAPAAGGLRKGRMGDEHRMFYPTSLKLWRMKEEIESSIDLWVTKSLKREDVLSSAVTTGANIFSRPKSGTVESWRSARASKFAENESKQEKVAPLLAIGTAARKEMLLERLPFMLLIAKARRGTSSNFAIEGLEKVATFYGIGGQSDDNEDENEDNNNSREEWATDKPFEGTSPHKKKLVIRGRGRADRLPLPQQQEQKLVLSDDDIEDD